MNNIYSSKDIMNRIKDSITYYDSRINAWQKVKRVHKKDGADYKILSKNFINCRFTSDYSWDRKIKVRLYDKPGLYDEDFIYLTDSENHTPDDIEKMITDLIDNYKMQLDKNLQLYEQRMIVEEFCDTVTKALNKVKDKCGDANSLYYGCRDFMGNLR